MIRSSPALPPPVLVCAPMASMLSSTEQQVTATEAQSNTAHASPALPSPAEVQKEIKVLFTGPSSGKSLMIVSYLKLLEQRMIVSSYDPGYIPRTADPITFSIQIDGKTVVGVTEDTPSSRIEEYDQLRPLAYRNAEVVIVVFAIDNEKALQSAKDVWVPEVRQILPNIPILLVGTKADKRPINEGGIGTPCKSVPISKAAAQKAGKSIKGVVCTMECSSWTQSGLHAVFDAALRAAVAHRAAAAAKKTTQRRCTVS